MSEGFRALRGARRVVATFTVFEGDLLVNLCHQVIDVLLSESEMPKDSDDPLEALLDFSGPTSEPEDPVLRRLLPDAHRNDPEAAGEFRRYTQNELIDLKVGNAATLIHDLHQGGLPDAETTDPESQLELEVELSASEGLVWLKTLTDIRLSIATRLGIAEGDEDYWDSLPDEDPRGHAHDIYEWVGWIQETLVRALDRL